MASSLMGSPTMVFPEHRWRAGWWGRGPGTLVMGIRGLLLITQRACRVTMGSPAPSPEQVLPWILSKREGEGGREGGS